MADDDEELQAAQGEARWLTTFGDAMTLLLTFFVLLFSMSTIEKEKFQVTISSFQGAVGVFKAGKTMSPGELMDMGINVNRLSEAETTISENIPTNLAEQMQANKNKVQVKQQERGIVIQITDKLLFDRGEVELTPEGKNFLHKVAILLKAPKFKERQVRVEGHADTLSVERYDSNWQLSVLRSANVVEEFTENIGISPHRISAVGYGSTRPVASNSTPEGRAKNRRVSIVILREDLQRN